MTEMSENSSAKRSEKRFVLSPRAVIRDAQGRCLLVKRSSKSTHQPGLWELPGGKMDPGETFDQTLLREVAEETGLVIALDRVVAAAQWEHPQLHVAYIIMAGHVVGGEVRMSDEHDDWAWAGAADIATLEVCSQYVPCLEAICSTS